ncbi:outer membrane protein assembly factor BamB family protein [Nakamurella sp. GG22]
MRAPTKATLSRSALSGPPVSRSAVSRSARRPGRFGRKAVAGLLGVTVLLVSAGPGTIAEAAGAVPVSPRVTVGAAAVLPTGSLTLAGNGFRPAETADVLVGTVPVASIAVDGAEAIGTSIVIPATTRPGPVPIVVTGRASRLTASASVIVRTDWQQAGLTAAHSGTNPFEAVLGRGNVATVTGKWASRFPVFDDNQELLVSAGKVFLEGGARRTDTGAGVWSQFTVAGYQSMAVDADSAYAVSSFGAASAFDEATGEVRWTVDLGFGDGNLMYPSDITVAGEHLIVTTGPSFGTVPGPDNNGRVFALRTTDGTLLWSRTLTRPISAAAVSGQLAFIGTDDGRAIALRVNSGAVAWIRSTGDAVLSEPAVSGSSVVFGAGTSPVGDGVTPIGACALDTATGAVKWSYDVSARYVKGKASRPAIADGLVYIGLTTTDKTLYGPTLTRNYANGATALDLANGTLRWVRELDGVAGFNDQGFWATPTVAAGIAYFGSCGSNQKLLALNSADGTTIRDINPVRCGRVVPVNGRLYVLDRDGIKVFGLPVELPAVTALNDTAVGTGPQQLQYSTGWTTSTAVARFHGNDHRSQSAGSTVTVRFSGTGIRYWFSMGPNQGIAGIRIDGGAETAISQYDPVSRDGALSWTSPPLTNGTHTATIRVTGTKNPSATGTVVTVDRIDIGR